MSGCKEEKKLADPKGVLKERAESYWTKRLIEKDVKATYEMELEKGTLAFSDYQQRVANAGQIDYLSIRADEVHIKGDQATVKLTMKYRIKGIPKEMATQVTDRWVVKGGEVMHVLEEKRKLPVGMTPKSPG